jgi:hypothetical protein
VNDAGTDAGVRTGVACDLAFVVADTFDGDGVGRGVAGAGVAAEGL